MFLSIGNKFKKNPGDMTNNRPKKNKLPKRSNKPPKKNTSASDNSSVTSATSENTTDGIDEKNNKISYPQNEDHANVIGNNTEHHVDNHSNGSCEPYVINDIAAHKKNSNKNTNARTPSESGSSTTKVFTENIPNYNGSSVTTNVTDEESINSGQRDIPNYNGLTDEESVNSGQRDNPNYNGLSDTTNVTDGESVKSGHRENGKYYLKSHKSNHSNHSIDMPKKDSTATDLVVQEKLHKVEDNVDTAITNQSSHVSDDNTTNEGVRSIPLSPQLDHLPVIQGSNMSENPRKSLDANESGSPLVDQELKQANTSLPSVANNGAIVSRELSRELLFSKNLYIGQVEQLPSIYLTFYYLGWYTEAIFERIANSLNIVDQHTGIPLSRLFLWMFSLKSWLGIKNEDLEKLEAAKKSE